MFPTVAYRKTKFHHVSVSKVKFFNVSALYICLCERDRSQNAAQTLFTFHASGLTVYSITDFTVVRNKSDVVSRSLYFYLYPHR